MNLFYRKALHLGPLRLNLSKSGLGASVGVTGARVGVDAKGKGYVAGGRNGIYFRETLETASLRGDAVPPLAPSEPPRSLGPTWIIIVALVLGLLMAGAILGRV
jgi:hypothetical protein